ncbi:signal peptidase II [Chloroflexota bacterium]
MVKLLQGNPVNVIFPIAALLIIVTDQLSKVWIRTNLTTGESLSVIGPFRLTHINNTGAAFGLFPNQSLFLTITAIVGVTAILVYFLFFKQKSSFINNKRSFLALGLILGGATGNLIDRLNPGIKGVTDFIDVGFWPIFNIADSAIVIGALMLTYFLIKSARGRTDASTR